MLTPSMSVDLDDLSAPGRLHDRIGDAEILQTVATAHQRLGVSADYGGKMFYFQSKRVRSFERNGFLPEWLIPGPVLVFFVVAHSHRRNRQRTVGACRGPITPAPATAIRNLDILKFIGIESTPGRAARAARRMNDHADANFPCATDCSRIRSYSALGTGTAFGLPRSFKWTR